MKTNDQILNSTEAAAYLGVHVQTLRKWVRKKSISHIKYPGNVVRFRIDDLVRWQESKTVVSPNIEHPEKRRRRKREEIEAERLNKEIDAALDRHYKTKKGKAKKGIK